SRRRRRSCARSGGRNEDRTRFAIRLPVSGRRDQPHHAPRRGVHPPRPRRQDPRAVVARRGGAGRAAGRQARLRRAPARPPPAAPPLSRPPPARPTGPPTPRPFEVPPPPEPLMPALPITVLRHSSSVNIGTYHSSWDARYARLWGNPLLRRFDRRVHARIAVS